MIKPEDFYQNTTKSLSEIRDKIDENQKETNGKIADLDKKVSVHIGISDALGEEDEKEEDHSQRNNHFITGIIVVVGLGAMTIITSLFT